VLLLASSAGALHVPHNAKRVNIYGVGTIIDGYGLQQAEGLIVDPVIATLEESASAWDKHAECLLRNRQGAASDAAREEAARKLVSNHAMVLRDVTNSMPRSQLHLERVAMIDAPFADQALRETSRRLLGCPDDMPAERPETPEQAQAWARTAAYLLNRLQGTRMECPGRDPDMSEAAAAAMREALAEVESLARAAMA